MSPLNNLGWYCHFWIRYEFYASVQIQPITKTEGASFSSTNVAWTYAVNFFEFGYPGSAMNTLGTRSSPIFHLFQNITFLDMVRFYRCPLVTQPTVSKH